MLSWGTYSIYTIIFTVYYWTSCLCLANHCDSWVKLMIALNNDSNTRILLSNLQTQKLPSWSDATLN